MKIQKLILGSLLITTVAFSHELENSPAQNQNIDSDSLPSSLIQSQEYRNGDLRLIGNLMWERTEGMTPPAAAASSADCDDSGDYSDSEIDSVLSLISSEPEDSIDDSIEDSTDDSYIEFIKSKKPFMYRDYDPNTENFDVFGPTWDHRWSPKKQQLAIFLGLLGKDQYDGDIPEVGKAYITVLSEHSLWKRIHKFSDTTFKENMMKEAEEEAMAVDEMGRELAEQYGCSPMSKHEMEIRELTALRGRSLDVKILLRDELSGMWGRIKVIVGMVDRLKDQAYPTERPAIQELYRTFTKFRKATQTNWDRLIRLSNIQVETYGNDDHLTLQQLKEREQALEEAMQYNKIYEQLLDAIQCDDHPYLMPHKPRNLIKAIAIIGKSITL